MGNADLTNIEALRSKLAEACSALIEFDHNQDIATGYTDQLAAISFAIAASDTLLTELAAARAELADRGKGHMFEHGTPEAIRDARLRNEIFNCVEQHPTKPKIATWYYERALQLISDYRAELIALREAEAGQWVACSERMPESGEPIYFVLKTRLHVFTGALVGDGVWSSESGYHSAQVTHWMPRFVQSPPPAPPGAK